MAPTPKARPVHRWFAALLALLTTTGPGALAPVLALGGGMALASASTASAQSACALGAAKAAPGYVVHTFVTGLPYNSNEVDEEFNVDGGACIGPFGMAFSGSTAYVTTSGSPGGLYRFGPGGGAANVAHEVDSTPFQAAPLFDRGHFYVIENYADPEHASIAEVSPHDGVTLKAVATGLDCPQYLVADPLNGNLFTQDGCSGWPSSSTIDEVLTPAGAHPTVKSYVTITGASSMGGIAFAPDGTLYVLSGAGIAASVPPGGGKFTTLFRQSAIPGIAPGASAVAVAKTGAGGQASALWVTVFTDASQDASQLYLVSLTASPPTAKLVLTAAGAGSHLMSLTIGPHGCVYVTSTSSVLRVNAAGQACT